MRTYLYHPVYWATIDCDNMTPFIEEVYQCMQDFCEEMNNDTEGLFRDFEIVIWFLKDKIKKIEAKYPEERHRIVDGPMLGETGHELCVDVYFDPHSWACITVMEGLYYEAKKADPLNFHKIVYEDDELLEMRVKYKEHKIFKDAKTVYREKMDSICEIILNVKTKFTHGREILVEYIQKHGTGIYSDEFEDYVWSIVVGVISVGTKDTNTIRRICRALEVAEKKNKRISIHLAPEFLYGIEAEEFRKKHPKYPPELIGSRSGEYFERKFIIEYI